MPYQNPLTITKTARVGMRMANDMPRINDKLGKREFVNEVYRVENPASPMLLFSGLIGNSVGVAPPNQNPGMVQPQSMFDIQRKTAGSEYLRIRKYREYRTPARVVDNSGVPDVLRAGYNFPVTLDKFIGESGENVLLKDRATMLHVVSFRTSPDGKIDYTFQLVGQPGNTMTGSILSVDSPVNWGFGNSMGEASLTSNSILDDGDKYTDWFNVMQIQRYQRTDTGSALSDTTRRFIGTDTALDGSSVNFDGVLDMDMAFFRKAAQSWDGSLLYNVPNFSITEGNRQIANRANTTRYPERPIFAGVYWQMDQAPYKYYVSKYDPLSQGVALLNLIMDTRREQVGMNTDFIAYASGGGRRWLKDVFFAAFNAISRYQINIVTDDKGKLGGGAIGFDIDTYRTPNGSITIVDLEMGFQQWGNEFNQFAYGDAAGDARSNRIYIQPTVVKTDAGMKKPVQVYFKEGNGVNRSLVLGSVKGMTGLGNSASQGELGAVQEAAVQQMMSNQKYDLGSTADMNEKHLLTQFSPVVHVDNMTWIQLY